MRGVTLKALRPVADRDGPGAQSGDLNSKKVNLTIFGNLRTLRLEGPEPGGRAAGRPGGRAGD